MEKNDYLCNEQAFKKGDLYNDNNGIKKLIITGNRQYYRKR